LVEKAIILKIKGKTYRTSLSKSEDNPATPITARRLHRGVGALCSSAAKGLGHLTRSSSMHPTPISAPRPAVSAVKASDGQTVTLFPVLEVPETDPEVFGYFFPCAEILVVL
jgi:hypothetical protein